MRWLSEVRNSPWCRFLRSQCTLLSSSSVRVVLFHLLVHGTTARKTRSWKDPTQLDHKPRYAKALDKIRSQRLTPPKEEARAEGLPTPEQNAHGAAARENAPPPGIVVDTGSEAPAANMRRRSTQHSVRSRRSHLSDGRTIGRSTARQTKFTLAGPADTPQLRTAHEPFVSPGYADLNPEYDQPHHAKPVWGLAKAMPRIVRPGMIPTRDEVVEAALNPELPAENSHKVGVEVDPNELEAGRMDASLGT